MPVRYLLPVLSLLTLSGLVASCAGGSDGAAPASTEILIAGVGPNGIFDPSISADAGGTLWMAYSEVRFSPVTNKLLNVRSRIASSSDSGTSWADAGIVNDFIEFTVPDPGGGSDWNAVWQQEVARIEYDAGDADATRRWKLLWHRYVYAYDPNTDASAPIYEHGWIGLKVAASPAGLAAASERKLFTGSWYNSAVNGASEFPLASTYAALNDCAVFTEPGVLAVNDGVYVALYCAPDTNVPSATGKIALLKCTHTAQAAFAACSYLGNLLVNSEAAAHGAYTGFSAPDLVRSGGKDYLIVTPTNNGYRGCLVYEIANLATASLVRDAQNKAVVVKSLTDSHGGTHYGACGYHAGATASGILDSSYKQGWSPQFRVFASKTGLP
jgi:hypothetical protein